MSTSGGDVASGWGGAPLGQGGAPLGWGGAPLGQGGAPLGQGGRTRAPSGGSNRAALVRLVVSVALIVAVVLALHGWAVLVVVLAIIAMVMLHEFGHFVTAKWSGMKVTEFFVGFGPRVWSVRRGETEYGVKAIPAGGYVRIIGMTSADELSDEDEPRSYRQASFPRRLLVAVAGSTMHLLIAIVLLWVVFAFAGTPVSTPDIAGIVHLSGAASPAQQAGLHDGDVVVAVDGHKVGSTNALVSAIEGDAGKRISLTVRRDGKLLTLHATPVDGRKVKVAGSSTPAKSGSRPVGFLGVELGNETVTQNPLAALGHGVTAIGPVTVTTATGIAQVFSLHGLRSIAHSVATAGQHHVASAPAAGASGASGASGGSGQLLSIYGAIWVGAQALRQDVYGLLWFLVYINIFIGMINLFPMLPLDGGHVLIAVYERVRSRRGRRYFADVNKLMPVAYAFLAFMVIIGLSALYANILNPPSIGG
ncbi:MAG TPA: site-2 protease family protein [Acidimicrobiales bacterium]|nr:site-2 protease family protein [Acidimicrobiales bacterium]